MQNPHFVKITATALSLAILTSACENLTPSENAALFGGITAVAVGVPLALAGVNPRVVVPITVAAAAIAAGASYVIAKHQATERQRKVAEQRARIYMARRAEANRIAARSSSSSRTPSNPGARPGPKETPAPRYIAVNTEPSAASPKGTSVMIYDTQSSQIVGNNVYDLKSQPKTGQATKYETYTAQYVGNGN